VDGASFQKTLTIAHNAIANVKGTLALLRPLLVAIYCYPWALLVLEVPELVRKTRAPVWSAEFVLVDVGCSINFITLLTVYWFVFWYFHLSLNNALDNMRAQCQRMEFDNNKSSGVPLSSHLDFIQCLTSSDARCSIFGIIIDTKLCLLHVTLVIIFVFFASQQLFRM
jgi:hypothetical protein